VKIYLLSKINEMLVKKIMININKFASLQLDNVFSKKVAFNLQNLGVFKIFNAINI